MTKFSFLTLFISLSPIFSLYCMERHNAEKMKRLCIEKLSNEESGKFFNLGMKELNAKNYESASSTFIFCFIMSQDSIFKALSATSLKALYKKNKIPKELKPSVKAIIKKDKTIKYSIVPISK